jgi:hypothetical protein
MISEKLEKYYDLKTSLSFLLSPYSIDIDKNKKDMDINKLVLEIEKLQIDVDDELTDLNPELLKINNDLLELNSLRTILSKDSVDSMQKIDNMVLESLKIKSNILDYNPKLYFDQYFYINALSQNYISNDGVMIKNENFNRWFGNSVVKENNEPLIVYHGTGSTDFTRFNFDLFPGMYFAEKKSYSEWFKDQKGKTDGILFECYLRITNPIDLRIFKTDLVKYDEFVGYIELMYGYRLPENEMLKAASKSKGGMWAWCYLRGGVDWLNFIKKDGKFDGIKFFENNPSHLDSKGIETSTPAWMVFNSNQIKLAKNNSIYSLNSEDIRMKKGGKL